MAEKKKEKWVQIGEVGVDAGLVWLGDPCYVLGDDASHRVASWTKFCEKLGSKQVSEPLGSGIGLAIESGYGDGVYPVYAVIEEGRVKQVRVDFF